MAIARVQSKKANATSSTPNITLTSSPTQGNLIVAWLSYAGAAGFSEDTGTYSTGVQVSTGAGTSARGMRMYYKIAGASESATINFTAGASNPWGVIAIEYSGIDTVSPLVVENCASYASGGNTTPAVTPGSGKDTVCVFALFNRNATAWSSEAINGSTTGVSEVEDIAAGTAGMAASELFVASTASGTYTGTGTPVTNAVGAGEIAFFLAAATLSTVAGMFDRSTPRRRSSQRW